MRDAEVQALDYQGTICIIYSTQNQESPILEADYRSLPYSAVEQYSTKWRFSWYEIHKTERNPLKWKQLFLSTQHAGLSRWEFRPIVLVCVSLTCLGVLWNFIRQLSPGILEILNIIRMWRVDRYSGNKLAGFWRHRVHFCSNVGRTSWGSCRLAYRSLGWRTNFTEKGLPRNC